MTSYKETNGFQGGMALRYALFDSSNPVAAAIEHVTYAPALNNLPTLNDDSTASSRASLAAFTNGQTGASNPNRQGLNSAILDGLAPLNVLRWNPSQGRYSPMWDAHLTRWQVPLSQRTLQTDFGTIQVSPITGPSSGSTAPRRAPRSPPAASSSTARSSPSRHPDAPGRNALIPGPPDHPLRWPRSRHRKQRYRMTATARPGEAPTYRPSRRD